MVWIIVSGECISDTYIIHATFHLSPITSSLTSSQINPGPALPAALCLKHQYGQGLLC